MRRILIAVLALSALSSVAFGQGTLPNLNYAGVLNATCSNANTACSNGVVVNGGLGISGPPSSAGSGSDLDVPVNNYAAAFVTVSGTYAGVTINFELSDAGGVNYFQEVCARTDINLLEISEVLPSNQVRGWSCPVWAGTRFRIRASAYTSGNVNVIITLTQAAIDPSLVVAASISNVAGASDPCQDVSAIKSSAVLNLASATTTLIKSLQANQQIYVCSWDATIAGSATTAGTIQFEYGTQSSTPCDTAPTLLTGAYIGNLTAGVPTFMSSSGPGTLFAAAASKQLCAVTTGTTVSIQGRFTYVQQ